MSKKKQPKKESQAELPTPKPKSQPAAITTERFIAVWNSMETMQAVAEYLGLAASTCANYATRLRETGQVLKEFVRGRPRAIKM